MNVSALEQAKLAVIFLTRVKLTLRQPLAADALAGAMRFFPLVGALIGLAVGLVFVLMHRLVPAWPAAALALAAGLLLTGALHEDGLADCADGFGGGSDRHAKLRIMRDSAIGSYGALALMLSLLLRAAALAGLPGDWVVVAGLMVAHAVARATLPLAMLLLPPASDSGVAAGAGRPAGSDALIAILLALAIAALLLPGGSGAAAIAAAFIAALLFGLVARRQIGGYSGDVLGAMEQLAEIAALLAILASVKESP